MGCNQRRFRLRSTGMPHPYCPEGEHLLAQYETALRDFHIAVQALVGKYGLEFQNEAKRTERFHEEVKRARDRLERHSLDHGCGYSESPTSA
jgi:hypothetical protein